MNMKIMMKKKASDNRYLLYSSDELIPKIPLLCDSYMDPQSYTKLMESIPKWMDMAKTACPDARQIWMSERETDIAETTRPLLVNRSY